MPGEIIPECRATSVGIIIQAVEEAIASGQSGQRDATLKQ
jgi:hypothetical protein